LTDATSTFQLSPVEWNSVIVFILQMSNSNRQRLRPSDTFILAAQMQVPWT